LGQVHLIWDGGKAEELFALFETVKAELIEEAKPLTVNMEKRGGGLLDLKLIDRTADEAGYYQIWAEFETCDAMGANFINSVLELLGRSFKNHVEVKTGTTLQVVMAIL